MLLAILKTFQLADCAGLLWMLCVDRFAAHVALASTKNRYYSIAWLRPSFFLSLYCSQWKRRSWDSLETDKTSGRFWVFVSGRFCDRTEEREKLWRAEDLPPKTEGLAPLWNAPPNVIITKRDSYPCPSLLNSPGDVGSFSASVDFAFLVMPQPVRGLGPFHPLRLLRFSPGKEPARCLFLPERQTATVSKHTIKILFTIN